MKIIYAGTPEFASVALEKCLNSKHQVVAVYTQPDRPKGRGLKLQVSPVKELALQYQIPVYQPASLKELHEQEILANSKADVMVVAAYGILLPSPVLRMLRFGCINIHPSLLPRWRGAAPIPRTIQAGDKVTGVTIMQMDEGLDTGPILSQRQYVLDYDETSQTLHDQLAELGSTLLLETLDDLLSNKIIPRQQDTNLATYAHKICKEEALLDWSQSANELEQIVRAFNPWPVAYTTWQEQSLRIWMAKSLASEHQAEPRTILQVSQEGIDIAAGKGVLRLLQLQLPGGKVLSAADFYNARRTELKIGQHFI